MKILADHELPPLQPQDHPEPHSMRWSDAELRAIRARDRLVEAAVLAKLREQEPQDIAHVGQGLVDVWKSRAAPLPAVVQVPLPHTETEAMHDAVMAVLYSGVTRGNTDALWQAYRRVLLAAASEAPATAVVQVPPIPLNIIRKWPDGFEARLQHVWKDVISFIPNVKLWDLQRVLAEFGFRMEVYDQTSAPEAPAQASAVDERAAFEAWLGIKPCGAAHEFGWDAWQARAALAQKGGAA